MSVAQQLLTGTFDADPDHSSLQFAIKHMQVATYRASFEDVTATVEGDEAGLRIAGRSKVESITIKTPADFREHVVNGENFFDGSRHPTVEFRSDSVSVGPDGALAVEGALTLRGVTAPVKATGSFQLPVEDPYGKVRAAIELRATIDRRDWGIDYQAPLPKGGNVLGWDVELTVSLSLIARAAEAA
jgi:polyisoprenoid-binding protein YceI